VLNQKKQGKTIILSTHDMASVEELCDNITLINKSKSILEGSVSDIRQQFKRNKYEIIYSSGKQDITGYLGKSFQEEKSEVVSQGLFRSIIQAPESVHKNDLLKNLIEKIEIHSYKEILPSMNEIFIQAVSN
jgi:ABC-2 type transport system ATP-binding protein